MPDTNKEGSSNRPDGPIGGTDFEWEHHAGILFDLDGVITPTATIHESAWRELFRDYEYTESDYLEHIDGKPRYDGVRSFLASRGVELPHGSPSDPPGTATVCGMGNRKNELFTAMLERDGIEPFPGSMATLELLAAGGIPAAIVSSSKNAVPVLVAAGLEARFDVVIDGLVAEENGLNGKPAPDGYLLGASRLGVAPERTVVVEDAVAGVAAGAAGHFAVTIGVDRGAGADALLAAGATFVVGDLAELLPERAVEPTD
jgi:beta-phosphoglucomutase family hydrolase